MSRRTRHQIKRHAPNFTAQDRSVAERMLRDGKDASFVEDALVGENVNLWLQNFRGVDVNQILPSDEGESEEPTL